MQIAKVYMNLDEGKKIYSSYEEAERVARAMQATYKKNFTAYRTEGGWVIGGVHINAKKPYKRVKSFNELRALFVHLDDAVDDQKIEQYANLIEIESQSDKESSLNGQDEGWLLKSWSIATGRDLSMNNDKEYLVLHIESKESKLDIQMGGAFSPSIDLISKQAQSLIGKCIVWHTWNSYGKPNKWSKSKWFYMIEST